MIRIFELIEEIRDRAEWAMDSVRDADYIAEAIRADQNASKEETEQLYDALAVANDDIKHQLDRIGRLHDQAKAL